MVFTRDWWSKKDWGSVQIIQNYSQKEQVQETAYRAEWPQLTRKLTLKHCLLENCPTDFKHPHHVIYEGKLCYLAWYSHSRMHTYFWICYTSWMGTISFVDFKKETMISPLWWIGLISGNKICLSPSKYEKIVVNEGFRSCESVKHQDHAWLNYFLTHLKNTMWLQNRMQRL